MWSGSCYGVVCCQRLKLGFLPCYVPDTGRRKFYFLMAENYLLVFLVGSSERLDILQLEDGRNIWSFL